MQAVISISTTLPPTLSCQVKSCLYSKHKHLLLSVFRLQVQLELPADVVEEQEGESLGIALVGQREVADTLVYRVAGMVVDR